MWYFTNRRMSVWWLPLFLSSLIFQNCHIKVGVYDVKKNETIYSEVRVQTHRLNDNFFKAVKTNNTVLLKEMILTELTEKNGKNIQKIINVLTPLLKSDSYRILDEYYIQNSTTGIMFHIGYSGSGDKEYMMNYIADNKEMYIALLLPNKLDNEILITAIYGKYGNDWKISAIQIGWYNALGKSPFDLYNLAKESYNKSYLIDAANFAYLANACLQPAGELLHYRKENEIKSFYEKVIKELKNKYQFPVVLGNIDSKPKIFNIYPETNQGLFPVIRYLSTINLKDTAALKIENEKIKKEIGQVFPGLTENKKYIYYQAFNEMPIDYRLVHGYNFIDSNTNKTAYNKEGFIPKGIR